MATKTDATPRSPSTRARLADVEGHIAELEAQLKHLRGERVDIIASLRADPVLTLPAEIISEIFILGVAAGWTTVLVLAHICHSWRAIALGTGELWSTINIGTVVDGHHSTEKVQFWLDNVRGHRLDLRVHLAHPHDCLHGRLWLVSQRSSQWAGMRLTWNGPLPSLWWVTPRLEQLTKIDIGHTASKAVGVLTAFAEAPNLRDVYLTGITRDNIVLPWLQITRLGLKFQTPRESLQILEQTTGLKSLDFRSSYAGVQDRDPAPTISLENLESLRIGTSEDWLLHHLTLPSLRCIDHNCPDNFDIEEMHALVQRSGCTVQSLHIRDGQRNEISAYLRRLRTVCALTLTSPCEDEGDLHTLMWDIADREGTAPALTSLAIEECSHHVDAYVLASMVTGREGKNVAQIRSLSLSFYEGMDDYHAHVQPAIENLRKLYSSGLKISIQGAPHNATSLLDERMAAHIQAEWSAQ